MVFVARKYCDAEHSLVAFSLILDRKISSAPNFSLYATRDQRSSADGGR